MEMIDRTLRMLVDYPEVGRIRRDLPENYRLLPAGEHLILFRNQYIDCVTLTTSRKISAFGTDFDTISRYIDREMVLLFIAMKKNKSWFLVFFTAKWI